MSCGKITKIPCGSTGKIDKIFCCVAEKPERYIWYEDGGTDSVLSDADLMNASIPWDSGDGDGGGNWWDGDAFEGGGGDDLGDDDGGGGGHDGGDLDWSYGTAVFII